MAMTTFKRIAKNGFLNFRRGGLVSWAAVLVVTITLSVVTLVMLLQAVLHFSLNQIKDFQKELLRSILQVFILQYS